MAPDILFSSPIGTEIFVDRGLRVLIYTTCYNVLDGVSLTVRKLEKEITASGGHVCILTTRSGQISNTNISGKHANRTVIFMDNAIELPFMVDPRNPDLSYYLGFSLSKYSKSQIKQFNPTIIHLTVPDCTGLHIINYARKHNIPLMGTYHSNIPNYMLHYPGMAWLKPILEQFFRHAYNFLQALYVPTPYIKKKLIKELKMDRVTNLEVWGRGVDLEKFSPNKRSLIFRHKYGIPPEIPVVLFVGRLVKEKSPDIFVEVIRKLNTKNILFRALVVGTGQCEYLFEGVPNCICAGWLSGDDLSEAYASSDIFLFPSSVETFGNVTLEAAASGLPLIVEGECSGHLVVNGYNGYACPAMDENAFYERTLQLVTDDNLRRSFSEKSVELSNSLENNRIVRQMIVNYTDIIYDFFDKYGGSHEIRDELYMNSDSFLAGTNPRPLLLSLFEYVFISIFLVFTNIMRSLTYFVYFGKGIPPKNKLMEINTEENFKKLLSNNTPQFKDKSCSSLNTGFLTSAKDKNYFNDKNCNIDDNFQNGYFTAFLISCGDSQCAITVARFSIASVFGVCRIMNRCFNFKCFQNCGGIDHRIDAYIRRQFKDSERNLSINEKNTIQNTTIELRRRTLENSL